MPEQPPKVPVHLREGDAPSKPEPRAVDPCSLVIFGASGDLTRRKLVPALHALHKAGRLPEGFRIVGAGRTEYSDDEFREQMMQACHEHGNCNGCDDDDGFADRLVYVSGDVKDEAFYNRIRERIDECTDLRRVIYYMSVPPGALETMIGMLDACGMTHELTGRDIEPAIIVEKPFGRDIESAGRLNNVLHGAFSEEQVYRIDHYLGKETVQNILVFRFANSFLEPIWNRKYVDYVEITASETVGVDDRAAFYEQAGAVRDMVQSHLLKVLTLVAMEQPLDFGPSAVRDERVKVIRSLRPIYPDQVTDETVRGQYGPGDEVPGYRQLDGVDDQSNVPTYVAVRAWVDNWRWQGVPFYLRTGKRLAGRLTEIAIHLKPIPFCFFGGRDVCSQVEPNILRLRIQPDEGIALQFISKVPGEALQMTPVMMDFDYSDTFGSDPPDAYERLLLDCMKTDSTLFGRHDEVEASWRWITPILKGFDKHPPEGFPNYTPGSEGPDVASDILLKGHRWSRLAGR
ncbi:MAG: glucose-6-phosphate dehydrogenase [Planctomycetota bacterium]